MEPEPWSHEEWRKNDQGRQLAEKGALVEAEAIFRELIQADTRLPRVYSNLAAICQLRGELEEALLLLLMAIELDGEDPLFAFNLGVVADAMGNHQQAIDLYARALELRPDYPEAGFNLSLCCFLIGDYARAWPLFEAFRFRALRSSKLHAQPALPLWDGTPLGEGALMLVGEQGMGDVLQFVRYAPCVRDQVGRVLLCVPARLTNLLDRAALADGVLAAEDLEAGVAGPGPATAWLPMMSLPGRLGVSPRAPGPSPPYLVACPSRVAHWRERLGSGSGPLVALHWQGNPEAEQRSLLSGRSMPLEALAPLDAIPGLRLVSLQKGVGSEQLGACSFRGRFVACQGEVDQAWDLDDTAAIMACCDLVITADSYPAHLAGALGLPVWLLLAKPSDWRWGAAPEASVWYPTMRLFRQPAAGDWHGVVEKVAKALQALRPRHGPGVPGQTDPSGR